MRRSCDTLPKLGMFTLPPNFEISVNVHTSLVRCLPREPFALVSSLSSGSGVAALFQLNTGCQIAEINRLAVWQVLK